MKKQTEFELDYCEKCIQMTNHLDGVCQKCKAKEKHDAEYAEYVNSAPEKFIATAAKMEWFIVRWFGKDMMSKLHKLAEDGEGSKLISIMNDIWFQLPDGHFNVMENPPGWNELLDIVTP